MPENDLSPMSKEEFAADIERSIAVMRARKEIGRSASDGFVASQLVNRLWLAGIRVFKGPGLAPARADQYPGRRKETD